MGEFEPFVILFCLVVIPCWCLVQLLQRDYCIALLEYVCKTFSLIFEEFSLVVLSLRIYTSAEVLRHFLRSDPKLNYSIAPTSCKLAIQPCEYCLVTYNRFGTASCSKASQEI